MRFSSLATAFSISSFLLACASDDTAESSDQDPCGLKSGWPGDELCILPPEPGEGVQIHAGPASYSDADVADWVIQPGDENVRCFWARIPEGGFYYFAQRNRMRSGSHHMLIGLVADEGQPEGLGQCSLLTPLGTISGSQTPARDFPSNDLGPEDKGLARYLPEGAMAIFQFHYVNTGKVPLLREAWVNLYRMEESEVQQRLQQVFLVADRGIQIQPGARELTTLRYNPTLAEPTRIFELNAHMHAHSESMAVWRVRGDAKELVYKSFDWAEPEVMTYNSVVDNPQPDDDAERDGGWTGILTMQPGDALEWSCDVNNTTNKVIGFANEAYTAEMCLLSGSYISEDPWLFAGMCVNGNCSSFGGF